MKTILVTGAAGRIGRLLCAQLAKKGDSVRAFVQKKGEMHIEGGLGAGNARSEIGDAGGARNKSECTGKIGGAGSISEFVGDILNVESINAAASDVDAIVHLAAIIDSQTPRKKLYEVNVQGTKNVLAAAPAGCKFVYASSVSVYGRDLPSISNENTPAKPSTEYGKSKYLAEAAVLCEGEKLDVCALQFGVVYGEGFEEGYFAVFRRLQNEKMKIIGKGDNIIPFVHVNDVVNAILLALERKTPSRVYLIVGEQKTQKELLGMAARELGVSPPTKHIERKTALALVKINDLLSRAVGMKSSLNFDALEMVSSHRAFEVKRAQKELGWKAKVKLRDGVKEMAKEYLRKTGKSG